MSDINVAHDQAGRSSHTVRACDGQGSFRNLGAGSVIQNICAEANKRREWQSPIGPFVGKAGGSLALRLGYPTCGLSSIRTMTGLPCGMAGLLCGTPFNVFVRR